METQQLSVLNVRSNASSESRTSSASAADAATADDQQAPFDEQLNQQIEQGKQAKKSENNSHNQQYTDADNARNGVSPEHSGESQQAQVVESSEPADGSEILQQGISTAFDLTPQPGTIGAPTEASVEADITLQLPQDGNLLPLAASPADSLQGTTVNSAPVSPAVFSEMNPQQNRQPQVIHTASTQLASTQATSIQATSTQAALNQANMQHSGEAQSTLSENSSRAAMLFSDMQLNRSQSIRNQSQAVITGELKTEMINLASQSSRLQQVPQTTAISAGHLTASSAVISEGLPLTMSAPATPPLTASLSANIASPQWSQQMSSQVALMLNGGIQQAEIKLNPAHLGPMEIKLAMNDDQTSIHFVTQHAQVRDAIDNALPRLREMLEQQGLNLADVDVSTQSEQQAKDEADSHSLSSIEDSIETEAGDTGNQGEEIVKLSITESGVSLYA